MEGLAQNDVVEGEVGAPQASSWGGWAKRRILRSAGNQME